MQSRSNESSSSRRNQSKITFQGFFISSAVEVPSYFVGWYLMDRWGRRWILFATMMTGGISCISCMFVPLGEENLAWYRTVKRSKTDASDLIQIIFPDASPWIIVTLAMIGKFQESFEDFNWPIYFYYLYVRKYFTFRLLHLLL